MGLSDRDYMRAPAPDDENGECPCCMGRPPVWLAIIVIIIAAAILIRVLR